MPSAPERPVGGNVVLEDLPLERAIREVVVIDAPVDQVWEAWTTPEGVRSFFAPAGELVRSEP